MAFKSSIASMSLGRAWVHELEPKLDQATKQHFEGIEIFYEDLEYHTKSLFGTASDENLVKGAEDVRRLCEERHLTIIGLQPFLHYEGLLDLEEHDRRIIKLKLWFQIVKALETDIIQIPSNFLTEGITGDRARIVADFQRVADLGAEEQPVIRFAYENLCWGTYFDTWESAWDIVAAVDRPNFGICLDTFNIAGRVWADPASNDGRRTDVDARQALKESLEAMSSKIDVEKVFYVQVVDAEKMRSPLVKGHAFFAEGQPARMSWSRNARLFAFEEGGYLPIIDILRTITEPSGLNFKGWISMELFSRTMSDPSPTCPKEHAERGMIAWKKLQTIMGWNS